MAINPIKVVSWFFVVLEVYFWMILLRLGLALIIRLPYHGNFRLWFEITDPGLDLARAFLPPITIGGTHYPDLLVVVFLFALLACRHLFKEFLVKS